MTTTASQTHDTSAAELDGVLALAASAAARLASSRPADRARMLRAVADALDAAEADLLPVAAAETRLPEQRLRAELGRTTFQLRMFAEVAEEGSFLEATIDTPDPNHPVAPRPDIRRVLLPLGPVLVFAASNFPFAFSVAGGDTASALAAGCPVVLKAHPGHPELSRRTAQVVATALLGAGAPEGSFALIEGLDAGTAALDDERITAGAFTGSLTAGRALFNRASARPVPIPFYAEMGSLNPVVVTPGAVATRGQEIARGFIGSVTLGTGQFCTKPGLLFLPAGHRLEDALSASAAVPASPLLNERIAAGYEEMLRRLSSTPDVDVLVAGGPPREGSVSPTLLRTSTSALRRHADLLLQECFGPASLLVEYGDLADLLEVMAGLEGQLTAAIHAEDDETHAVDPLLRLLAERAGRVLWNGWPTGVAVTWAMHHGGPYPATTSPLHTSVGATAVRRFLRPVSYQSVPQALLPEALRDRNTLGISRRVDGAVTHADVPASAVRG